MINPVGNVSSSLGVNSVESVKLKTSDDNAKDFGTALNDLSFDKQDKTKIDAKVIAKDADKESVKNADKEKREPDYTDLSEKISKYLGESNLSIVYSLDKDTKKMVMKVINNETKETVRQFPSEVSIKIAKIAASVLDGGHVTNAKV